MADTASVQMAETEDSKKEEKEQQQEQPSPERPSTSSKRTIVGTRWVSIVLAVLSSTFFFGLDNTVVAVVQPIVVNRFDALDRLPWISVAFLVGAASTNFF